MARAFASASSQYLVGTNPVSAFPFTMACWFISNDLTSDHTLMDLTNSGASFDRESMRASGNRGGKPLNYLVGQSTQIDTSNSFSAGVWQHGAIIAAASNNRRAVLNGDWANSGTSATDFDDFSVINRVDIGRMGDSSPSSYLSGRVAEAAIWSVALTQVEITLLAAGASPLLVRPDALAAYWPLWGTHDPEIDLVGGYGLTLVNAPTVAVHPRVIYVPKLWAGASSTPSATIELTGIPSAEAVGRPAIDDGLTRIFPTGIPTAEAVGTPTATPGAVTIELTGVASAEAVGTPTVLLPTRRVTQTLAEVDGDWQPAVRVSQMLVEVDVTERIPIRITQALAEVDLLPPLELQGQAAGTSSAIGALDWFGQVAGDDGRAGRPEVRVEISRGRAPMESPDWEDVSDYLREAITIDRGRQKELGIVQCGTAQLTLDNRERRFEPGVTGRMPMQRIRISARLSEDDLPLPQRQFGAEGDIGGGWWALFSGYVESWEPEAFVDGSRDALVHVRCIDGFEPLARVMLNESFEQQLTGERIDAVLTACGWTVGEAWVVGSETNGVVGSMVLGPVNDRLLADGTSKVQAQELEQVPALQHIQQVADAEGGWFYINKLGLATFYDRHRLLSEAGRAPRCIWGTYRLGTETAPVYPYSGLLYSLGCEWIYNEVRLQAIDGEEQVQSDTDSIRHYFRRTLIKTDLPLAYEVDVEAMARFLLNRYREPVLRFDELSWEGAIPATACEALLALDMGDLVQVRQVHPAGGAIVAQDSVIQGVQYRIDESRWRVTMQLSPLGGPVSGYWIVGSSRLGIETVPAW